MILMTKTLFKKCSNCLKDKEDVFLVLKNENYYACPDCMVNYGKNRNGLAFLLDEEVFIKKYHTKTDGRIFIIKGIFIHEECESGRLIFLIDKETGNPLKSMLDINWLMKTSA